MGQIAIHPAVDKGIKPAAKDFAGGTLRCLCASDPVEVVITGQCAAQPRLRLHEVLEAEGGAVRAGRGRATRQGQGDEERRQAEDRRIPNALIVRHACRGCGVHMQGPVVRENHPFTGLVFIHTELSKEQGWAPPDVRGVRVVDHRIGHASPIRWRRSARGSTSWACRPTTACRPALMDYIATYTAKASGVLKD